MLMDLPWDMRLSGPGKTGSVLMGSGGSGGIGGMSWLCSGCGSRCRGDRGCSFGCDDDGCGDSEKICLFSSIPLAPELRLAGLGGVLSTTLPSACRNVAGLACGFGSGANEEVDDRVSSAWKNIGELTELVAEELGCECMLLTSSVLGLVERPQSCSSIVEELWCEPACPPPNPVGDVGGCFCTGEDVPLALAILDPDRGVTLGLIYGDARAPRVDVSLGVPVLGGLRVVAGWNWPASLGVRGSLEERRAVLMVGVSGFAGVLGLFGEFDWRGCIVAV